MSLWPAIAAAQARRVSRVPFFVGQTRVGSVATAHLYALHAHREHLGVSADRVVLRDSANASAALAPVNQALRDAGLIVAWRDETYAITTAIDAEPVALIERAASRFWGTLTFGAHCNGYVADQRGRPTHLWIARRSLAKPTDPGRLDNLVGGGVPYGQSPFDALVREGFEEAGLDAAWMRRATAGRVIHLNRDIPEGLQHEHLFVFDLALPRAVQPLNQDGEVAELRLLPIDEALALAASDEMTVDASLVTLDFALRHALLPRGDAEELTALTRSLWLAAP